MAATFTSALHQPIREESVPLAIRLTPRQLEVLELLAEGLPNKLICRRLNISTGTVKVHVANIMRTLNAQSRTQAAIIAHRYQLVGVREIPGLAQPAAAPRATLDEMSSRLAEIVSRVSFGRRALAA